MNDLTIEVTVTIHDTEMDLIAEGERICLAEPDVGIMRAYIEGWSLLWADGTDFPRELHDLLPGAAIAKIVDALNEALDNGDFDREPDHLREDRDERRRVGAMLDANPFKPEEAK